MWKKTRELFAAAEYLPPASPWAESDLARIDLADVLPAVRSMTVTRANAMKIGSVKRARDLICGQIAHYPLKVMRNNMPAARPPAWAHGLEPGRAQSVTLAWIVDALVFYGRAFLAITRRDSEGRPAAFGFVPEWEAKADGDGQLLEAFGRKIGKNAWLRIDSFQEGFLKSAGDDLLAMETIKAAAARAADNPVPAIELHQTGGDPLTDAEIDALINRWAEKRRARNGGVAFTNSSVEVKTHGTNAEALLMDARKALDLDIARHLNLPAWAVDGASEGGSLTYSNVPSRTRELIDYTLTPYMDAIAGRLSADDVLPRGVWCVFDTAAALQGSFAERMSAYKTAIDAGIYTVEEVKALELGAPLERTLPE